VFESTRYLIPNQLRKFSSVTERDRHGVVGCPARGDTLGDAFYVSMHSKLGSRILLFHFLTSFLSLCSDFGSKMPTI
jgi:hypothetical protein